MTGPERLDQAVAKRFRLTRAKAATLILAGRVKVDGRAARAPSRPVKDSAKLEYQEASDPVSRAGGKLAGALKTWQIRLTGKVALDVGASTGGFTEEMLARGAAKVYAVDTGRGQLAWKLRRNPKVINLERTDVRNLSLPEPPDLAVIDVSFISLTQVLPAIARLLPTKAPVIALFKPQFEVSQAVADRHRGVIRDQATVRDALARQMAWLDRHGWRLRRRTDSTVPGAKGNREILLWLESPSK
jgi:23S rRNA (cytidine1920-2'-O)/16S rRNA (cytidine1409-2'-O)-methyltransferase